MQVTSVYFLILPTPGPLQTGFDFVIWLLLVVTRAGGKSPPPLLVWRC